MSALSGLKVLDLSRVLAGPWCTQLLADLGAEVIKVEMPGSGDDTRFWGPPFQKHSQSADQELSAYFSCTNRNKKSIELNFKDNSDRQKILALVSEADVVVENYKVDSLKPYGLDGESLTAQFPQLIYCSISAFGQEGPYKDKPGYDALIQALSGLMSITGEKGGEPTKVGVAVSDILTGLYATVGIEAALLEKVHSGQGQWCQVSLLDSQVFSLANVLQAYLMDSRVVPQALGNHHPQIVPYGTFATAGDKMILISVGNDQQFADLSMIMQQDWHKQEEFSTNEQRVRNRRRLEYELEEILKEETLSHWSQKFEGKSFPAGPVNDLSEMLKDPQVLHNQIIKEIDGIQFVKNPIQLKRTPVTNYQEPPFLGDHNGCSWSQ